jgi:outer membrane protein assembly factor BamB
MIRKQLLLILALAITLGTAHHSQAADPQLMNERTLNQLTHPCSLLSFREKAAKIGQIHDWAQIHNPEQLGKAYKSLLKKNPDNDNEYRDYCSLLDRYAELDENDARKFLDKKIRVEILLKCPSFFRKHIERKEIPIILLKSLKKISSHSFGLTVHELIKTRLSSLLTLALEHPEQIALLEDERLSTERLIQETINNMNAHPENPENRDNFNKILELGSIYHTQFEHEIAKQLPNMLQCNKHIFSLNNCLQSPSVYLRREALSTYLTYISNTNNTNIDLKYKEWVIDDIFKFEKNIPLRESFYKELVATFQKSSPTIRNFGIQRLIPRLKGSVFKEFKKSIIAKYFKVPLEYASSVNNAFEYAIRENTLSPTQLSNIIIAAQKTKLLDSAPQNTLSTCKVKMLQCEEAPTKRRAQWLDELLIERLSSKSKYDDIKEIIKQLPSSLFAQFAQAMLVALNPEFHQVDHFAARAKLIELKKQYPSDFEDGEPGVLRRCYGQLFRGFNVFQKNNPRHIIVNKDISFNKTCFPCGPCLFGYAHNHQDNSFSLYALNEKNGLPLWQSPIKLKREQPYTLSKNQLYHVTDNNEIAQIDLSNGNVLAEISTDVDSKIVRLYATDTDNLFAIHDNHSVKVISLKEESGVEIEHSALVDNKLIIPTKNSFLIIDNKGNIKKVPHQSEFDLMSPLFQANSRHIFYTKIDNDGEVKTIICLESDTGKQLWEYPINAFREIIGSQKNDTVFVLTEQAVIALTDYKEERPIVWKTDIPQLDELSSMYLSNDDSILYGLQSSHTDGKIYTFDVKTGEKKLLHKDEELNEAIKVIGDINHKIYVHGKHIYR